MDQFTRKILLVAALPTLCVGLVASLAAFLLVGGPAALGMLLGVAVVIPFFTIGQLVLASVLRKNPTMGLTVALMLYLGKIGALAILLVILSDTSAFDTKAFAVNILLCTLVWTGAEVWILANSKILYVDPENVPEAVREQSKIHSSRD